MGLRSSNRSIFDQCWRFGPRVAAERQLDSLHSKVAGKRTSKAGDYYIGYINDPCVYCGEHSYEWEHVIPYSFGLPTCLVRACPECNRLAGSEIFPTIYAKQGFIKDKLLTRHQKLLRSPDWSEDELDEMGYGLRSYIQRGAYEKDRLLARLEWDIPDGVLQEIDLYYEIRAHEEAANDNGLDDRKAQGQK